MVCRVETAPTVQSVRHLDLSTEVQWRYRGKSVERGNNSKSPPPKGSTVPTTNLRYWIRDLDSFPIANTKKALERVPAVAQRRQRAAQVSPVRFK